MSASAVKRQAFVGAGANLGERAETLAAAVARLRGCAQIETVDVSSVYETEPVGVVDQPRFLNLVVGLETTLTPEDLLRALLAIERDFGRQRSERWGPRTLDLDLLLFEGETRASAELALPHPRMFERAFVTVPLLELLVKPRFYHAHWTPIRTRLEAAKNLGGVARLPREDGGERS